MNNMNMDNMDSAEFGLRGGDSEGVDIELLLRQFERAAAQRRLWESLWEDCYRYTFPGRYGFSSLGGMHKSAAVDIYDATAADAAEHLASGLLGELTPPFGKWLELLPSPEFEASAGEGLAALLEETRDVFHEHLQKSNFLLEMQQGFLDSVIVGTSVLRFKERRVSDASLFHFSALPLRQLYVSEGNDGRLSRIFRRCEYSAAELQTQFPQVSTEEIEALTTRESRDDEKIAVLEAVVPAAHEGYHYYAILPRGESGGGGASLLRQGYFRHHPFIAFRWMKIPGEDYGRSPVMKLLPDIKTANKVVELILKNAAIAVTGIWQADDDGVLNPANIKLTPGTIIPKAVGSKGLTPLQPAADFNLSQVILDELRIQIRRGLLYDQLNPSFSPAASATEIMDKSARTSRLLGATYGRMQSELLLPLAYRGLDILKRHGLIAPLPIDGINIRLRIQSPLARQQRLSQVQNALQFIDYAARLQNGFGQHHNISEMLAWLARQMEIPQRIVPDKNFVNTMHTTTNLLENNHAR